jgi:hypothetical protein
MQVLKVGTVSTGRGRDRVLTRESSYTHHVFLPAHRFSPNPKNLTPPSVLQTICISISKNPASTERGDIHFTRGQALPRTTPPLPVLVGFKVVTL